MGTIIRSVVTLAVLGFSFSMIIGTGKPFMKLLKMVTLPIIVVVLVAAYLRGVWIPNAGGGMAIKQNQTVQLDASDFPVSVAVGRDEAGELKYEEFEHNLEYYLRMLPSDKYNPELSHFLISMCNAIGDLEWMKTSLDNMQFQTEGLRSNYNMEELPLAYCIDQKFLSDDERVILVVLRGSSEDLREWDSNLNVIPDHDGEHSGFSGTAGIIYDTIIEYAGNEYDLSKTIFVITGHSRGAAVGNIVAAKLADQRIPQSHIFCYCFACPDTVFMSDDDVASYSCVFTINNVNDYVSWLPWLYWRESGTNYGFSSDTHWNKYGTSYWFSTTSWEECHVGLDNVKTIHPQDLYLDYLRQEPNSVIFKGRFEAEQYLK